MLPYFFPVFLVLLLNTLSCNGHGGELERQTLLISLDGFRWDYVDRIHSLLGDKSNIWQVIENGAYAQKGIKSTFTTMTFPNHYTLVTGLYQESHGIVSNAFYDPLRNKTHDLKTDHDSSIYGGEPIWTTLMKQKQRHMHEGQAVVACLMWVACQFGGMDDEHFVRYNEGIDWSGRIDRAIDWLSHESMKLVLLYYHEPDRTGHVYGPKSKEMDAKLIEIDSMIGELIRKLKAKKLFEELNLIIVSDHGMKDLDDKQTQPLLPQTWPDELFYLRSDEPTVWLVEPFPGRRNDTIAYFNKFAHLVVFEKPEIPDKWHYKHSSRITPLLIMAEPGYALSGTMKGNHGYDNDLWDMRPTFIAHGPAFVPNSTVPLDMSTVDVYLLLCAILDLTPAPNNGTALYIEAFVEPAYLGSFKDIFHRASVVTVAVIMCVMAFALCFFLCHRQRAAAHAKRLGKAGLLDSNGYMYKPLPLESVGPLLTTSVDLDSDDFDDHEPGNKKP